MTAPASADPIELFDYGFNIDGFATEASFGDPTPGNVDDSLFDYFTGQGTLSISIIGVGAHNTLVFVDHDIDDPTNDFRNENVVSFGGLALGQSWEVDEPGFVFGDIYFNFLDNTLDRTNVLTPGSEYDVSMALGWDFVLAGGESAIASFFLSETDDSDSAFVLAHADVDSDPVIYFWSTLEITAAVLKPDTLLLFGLGLLGLGLSRKRQAAT
jgi:hypothetical protein